MKYIVLDIETTGLSKYSHKITEIAAIKVHGNKIVEKYHSLINPEEKIPSFITRLTGIDNELVKDAPKINEILPSFKEFLEDHILVAHNATFDIGFISHNFRKHLGEELKNSYLCTRRLATRLPIFPNSNKLCDLCLYFNIENEQAHRAMGDTMATLQLLENFIKILEKNNILTIEDVHKFSFKPANICKTKIIC